MNRWNQFPGAQVRTETLGIHQEPFPTVPVLCLQEPVPFGGLHRIRGSVGLDEEIEAIGENVPHELRDSLRCVYVEFTLLGVSLDGREVLEDRDDHVAPGVDLEDAGQEGVIPVEFTGAHDFRIRVPGPCPCVIDLICEPVLADPLRLLGSGPLRPRAAGRQDQEPQHGRDLDNRPCMNRQNPRGIGHLSPPIHPRPIGTRPPQSRPRAKRPGRVASQRDWLKLLFNRIRFSFSIPGYYYYDTHPGPCQSGRYTSRIVPGPAVEG